MEPKLYVSRMDNLRARVRAAASLTLEMELSDLLSFEKNPRNRAMSLRHLGWAGARRIVEHLDRRCGPGNYDYEILPGEARDIDRFFGH